MIFSDRFEYIPTIHDTTSGLDKKGYLKSPIKKFIFGDEGIMVIPIQFQYRPDLISKNLYGTTKYAWLLAYINNFKNTPQDFKAGKEIIFTIPERLK